MRHQSIAPEDIEDVLLKSRRRCALCFASGDNRPKPGSIARIWPSDKVSATDFDNLVFLCQVHHYELDREARGREWLADRIKAARDDLYEQMEYDPVSVESAQPRVFISYTHNDEIGSEVVRLLRTHNLQVVTVGESQNLGRTWLDALDIMSDVKYAVVILPSKDSISLAEGWTQLQDVNANVLFEIGYLIGRLGRDRVCALSRGEPELPSDLQGVQIMNLDSQGIWKERMEQELQLAGVVSGE